MEAIIQRRSTEVEDLVIELFQGVTSSFGKAINAITQTETKLATTVLKESINHFKLKSQIFDKNVYFMAKNTPVATDLRRAVTTFGICNDLYRIEQYANALAEFTINNKTLAITLEIQEKIKEIGEKVNKMLVLSTKLYSVNDLEAWKDINVLDQSINDEYHALQLILAEIIKSETFDKKSDAAIEDMMHFVVIIKYLERSGDHIKNIANQCKMIHTGM
jgi:phosphate transport system protein